MEEYNASIGKQIRYARKKANMTVKELAEIVGIYPNTLYLIERSERKPSKWLCDKIQSVLDANQPTEIQILFDNLSFSNQETVIKLARFLLDEQEKTQMYEL